MRPGNARRAGAGLALVAALLPASALAAGAARASSDVPVPLGPNPAEVVSGAPTLQVSPELTEVRSGTPVTLVARISGGDGGPVPVEFEITEVAPRPRHERARPTVGHERCTVPRDSTRVCSISLVRARTTTIIRAWIDQEAVLRDDREGRLASQSPPPLADADCTLHDGEPFDARCRDTAEGTFAPGGAEPDGTDVVRVSWTGAPPAVIDCETAGDDGADRVARRSDDRTVDYLCQVRDRAGGGPLIGVSLNGEIMGGPFDRDRGAARPADYGDYLNTDASARRLCTTTSPQGHCQFTLRVPGQGSGRALVCFWPDGNADGEFGRRDVDGGDCLGEAPEEAEGNDAADAVEILFP